MYSTSNLKKSMFTALIVGLLLPTTLLRSQSLSSNSNWNKLLTSNKSFIENKGQFFIDPENRKEVLFSVDHSNLKIHFTKKGIVYQMIKEIHKTEKEKEREEEYEEALKKNIKTAEEFKAFEAEEHKIRSVTETVKMFWNEPNSDVEIIGVHPKNDYHSYNYVQAGGTLKNINYIKGFEKIIYKNLYPSIDVEYKFDERGGIKYSIILHPGAKPEHIKMIYDKNIAIRKNGDLHIETKLGDIIDHAPFSFYEENNSSVVASAFKSSGNSVTFSLADYDNSKTIIIDPWTQTPAFFSNWDCVWECEKDGAGNVYIIGGVNKMQLLKYNAGGTLQWTYNTPYDTTAWLGTFATDNAGNSYVTQGSTAAIQKVNTTGALVWNNASPSSQLSAEFWNITFNCDQTRLVIAGTGGAIPPLPYIYQVDVTTGNVVSSLQVTTANLFPTQEVRTICSSGNGKYYFLTHDSVGYINQSFSICGPNSSSIKKAGNTYGLSYKCENYRYNNSGIMAIRSSGSFFYTHRGDRIDKRSLSTLGIISSAPIPGGVYSGNAVQNSGIDIDACGNIYVGSKNQIIKYDANLVQLATYPTSSPYNVYDVHVSTGGDIIACGSTGTSATASRTGYIQSIAAGACNTMSLVCCDPSICIPPKKCITDPPFTLTVSTAGGTWSGTGVNASGVFNPATAGIGTHVITYSLACGSESISITVSSCTLNICQNSGSLVISGGTPTYSWASTTTSVNCSSCPFGCNFLCSGTTVPIWTATGSTISAPATGIFPIWVKDANGTTYTISSLASVPSCSTSCPTLTVTIPTLSNINCFGANTGSATAAVAGGVGPYTYTWIPGNLIGATQSGLSSGIYTINVKDVNGCTGSTTLTLTQPTSALSVSITNTSSLTCIQNGSATVNAFGGTPGYTYTWLPSGGNNAFATNLTAGVYTVSVTDAKGCLTNTTLTIAQNTVAPTISANSSGSLSCSNLSVVITGSSNIAGATYTWLPQNLNTSTISVTAIGSYSLSVSNPVNGCTSNTIVAVSQNTSVPSITVNTPAVLNCTTTSIILTGSSSTGGVSYAWQPGNITTSSLSVNSTGNYSLTITNPVNGCINSTVVAVTQSAVLPNVSASVNGTLTCTNTTVALNGNSSTGGVSYLWQPGNLSNSVSNVGSIGNYTLTVTNTLTGCSNSTVVTVSQNTVLPAVSASVSGSLTCTTNTIALLGTSATSGATFTWQPMNVNTSSAVASSSGNYTLNVTDPLNGCISSTVVTVIQAAGVPTITASASNSLNCLSNASTLTASSNGNAIIWNGGSLTNAVNPSVINTAGSYTATATNTVSGCTSSLVIAVTQNTIAPSITVGTPATLNCLNASVNLSGSSSSGGVNYTWQPGNVNTSTLTVASSGNYSLLITNPVNGCTSSTVITVTQNTLAPTISAGSSGTLTCTNTSVILTGNSTTSGVNYLWQPVNIANAVTSASTSGNYSLTVTNPLNGCSSTTVISITQNTVTPNVTAAVGGTLTCTNNTVTLTGASTSPGVTFLWQPVNLNSLSIAVSAAGNYSLIATDPINGCSNSTVVTVTQNGAFPAISVSNPGTLTCLTNSVILNGNSTTAGVSYSWSPQNVTTNTAIAASAGSYTFSVYDAVNGCTSYSIINVVQVINTPTLSVVKSNDLNCSVSTATLNANSTGNVITWNGGPLVNAANPVVVNVAGSYTAIATNPLNGCTSSSVLTVSQSSLAPSISVSSSGTLNCNTPLVTLTGASGTGGVNYQWTGGPASANYSVNSAGTYTFSVHDPLSGCSSFTTITVISVPMFTANAMVATPINCYGNSTGAIQINITGGGAAPFQISNINSSTTTSNVSVFPFYLTNLSAASYSIAMTDASGCSQNLVVNLSEPSTLNVQIAGNNNICEGNSNVLSSSVSGGTPNYSYLWQPGNGTAASLTTTPVNSTNYSLTVTDKNGCTAIANLSVAVNSKPTVSLMNSYSKGCMPLCETFSLAQSQNPNYTYSWNFSNSNGITISSGQYNPTICFTSAGNYNISISITSTIGCSASATYSNAVIAYPKPIADFNHAPIKPIINQDPFVTFTDASYGANIVSWNWYFMNTAQFTSNVQNPTFSYTEPGTYAVALVVKSDLGCTDTLVRPIEVSDDFGIYVPNAFTPNEDGLNDIFQPKGFGIVKYQLIIFDRWGEVVYKTNTFEEGWNGKYQGRGGDIVEQGVYTWLINVTSVFGKSHELKGHVTLIK